MCWCNPNIRTPNCGKLGCNPPPQNNGYGFGYVPGTAGGALAPTVQDLTGELQNLGKGPALKPALKLYKITREGGIVISEDGGKNWKHAEGVVINEQTIAHTEQLNQLVKELRSK